VVPVVWNQILATDFPARAEALADEVVDTRPDLIGLQEVTRYSTAPLNDPGNETVVLDFLEILMAELADRGQAYRVVVEIENFNGVQPNLAIGAFLRLVDRDVILARTDRQAGELMVSNPQSSNFETNLAIPVSFQEEPLVVLRGWVAVDVKTRGLMFRFVNTHLEAFDPLPVEGLRRAQVAELLAGPLDTRLPVVLAGDINSAAPDGPAYQLLLSAGLWDPWTVLRPGEPGFTCCHDADLRNEEPDLRSRIDVVLASRGFRAVSVEVVGDGVGDRIAGLWPSDHAGVVATLILDPPRSGSR
jgi:endonuclease/exonuclease/phosphatase family metal-dependent hydrolase